MSARVVVTGMGVVSPLGCGVEVFRDGLLRGDSGVGPITLFDAADLPVRIAAEARGAPPGEFADRKIAFALLAAAEALRDARACGSAPGRETGGTAAGLELGIGLDLFSLPQLAAWRRGGGALPASRSERLGFVQTPADLVLQLLAFRHGLGAAPRAHVTACAAGADALGAAFRLVRSGRRRWMLAGGADSLLNPLGVGGFARLGALSRRNDEPARASRPFDRRRDGFVLGEGAAVLVLERLEDARARGARARAEIAGYGSTLDAHAIGEPRPDGEGALAAMAAALADAGLTAAAVDCINAHGTGTPKNDLAEALAIGRLLGGRRREVPVCATKSMIGHLVAAAGAVEAVAAIACLEAGMVHPTVNCEEPDPACDLDCVPEGARRLDYATVLSNSFGFGGHNAALVLRRINDA